MIESGGLGEDARVELIDGWMVDTRAAAFAEQA